MSFSTTLLACLLLAVTATSIEVPEELDWRDTGLVTKVKDQLSCDGSFYFAALAVVESHYYLQTGKMLEFSEQYALDCSQGFNGGCIGGGVLNTIDFIRQEGIVLEEDYPYEGVVGDCRGANFTGILKTIGYKVIPRDEDLIKTIVGTVGPVAVTFDGTNISSYTGGIYSDSSCDATKETQSGVIVGYGTTEDGVEYWTVKMSFGDNWGEDGYVRIPRNADNYCGIAQYATYPLL